MFNLIKNAAKTIANVTKDWNWGAIGTGLTITTLIIGGVSNFVSKQEQKANIDRAAEEAVKKLMSPKE